MPQASFGLALGPDGSVRLVAELVGPWQFDAARETAWGNAPAMRPMNSVVGKVGRNDPCPCGSGKKYKRCCHEHTLLSHHLMRNLWLDSDVDMMLLHDDILVHLDIAMAVRRDGVSGAATPDGILTRFRSNALWADYREHRG
jgi:hypothetical protein